MGKISTVAHNSHVYKKISFTFKKHFLTNKKVSYKESKSHKKKRKEKEKKEFFT